MSSAGVMSNSLMFKPNEGTMTATAVHSSNTGVTISENVFTVRPEITYHSNPTLSRCSENLESLGGDQPRPKKPRGQAVEQNMKNRLGEDTLASTTHH